MRKAMATAAAVLLAAGAAAPALGDVKSGVDAWARGDYAAAVRAWEALAAAGDADAQFNLAQAYKFGRGVPANLKKAEELYRKAAVQGHMLAADNYGLLLFQTGRREEAMAWIVPSADRGESRAMYVLGIAYFNGDLVAKDPVRAYALMSRAAAIGLDQAKAGLATMDEAIPLEQRQQAVALAVELEQRAATLRKSQVAALDLGDKGFGAKRNSPPAIAAAPPPPVPSPPPALRPEPVTAGADFANPVVVAPVPAPPPPRPAAPAKAAVALAPPKPAPPRTAPAPVRDGGWRLQLGAFGVPGNAEALWAKLKGNPALAGREGSFVPAGRLTRLLAGPFASKAEAQAACDALGQACMVVTK